MSHVFISYARKDHFFVDRLREDLQVAGVDYWIDHEGLSPGTRNWEREIRNAIADSTAMIWVVSPSSYESEYVNSEIAVAEMNELKIYPVFADGRNWIECVPLGKHNIQFVDMRQEKYRTGFDDLIHALNGNKPEIAVPPEPTPELAQGVEPRNPYKGLIAFTEADTGDFFGRGALAKKLHDRIKQNIEAERDRFLAILGPSGAGKSSVVMAGLIPALKKTYPDWVYLNKMSPGRRPIEALADVLKHVMPEVPLSTLETDLNSPGGRYLHRLTGHLKGEQVVLYVDQFEEVFTLTTDDEERQQFIDLLTYAVTEPEGKVIVLLTMRADFFGYPMNYPQLGALMNQHMESVLPMTISELRDAIEKPARLPDVGLKFDAGLVAELIFALRERDKALAGALPLLQFTLERLFAEREDNRLTMTAYQNMGGVQGAIGQHAQSVYEGLPAEDEEKEAWLQRVFSQLVSVDERGTATRRKASLDNIHEDDMPFVERFVSARLLLKDKETLEVTHEALFTQWEALTSWIAQRADDFGTIQHIEYLAGLWDKRGRPDDMLPNAEEQDRYRHACTMLNITASDPLVSDFVGVHESDRLLEQLKDRSLPIYEFQSIIKRLEQIGGDMVAGYMSGLNHKYIQVIDQSADALTTHHDDRVIEPILLRLESTKHWEKVRQNTINQSIEKLLNVLAPYVEDERVIDGLYQLMQTHFTHKDSRNILIKFVCSTYHPVPVYDELIKTALEDSDTQVITTTLVAIRQLDGVRWINQVESLLSDERRPSFRRQTTIGQEVAMTLVNILPQQKAVELFSSKLDDTNQNIRKNAIYGLALTDDTKIYELLMTGFADPSEVVRLTTIRATRGLHSPIDKHDILTHLDDVLGVEGRRRSKNAPLLEQLGHQKYLIELLNDDSAEVRQEALNSLIELYPTQSESQVVLMLDDTSPMLRYKALNGVKDKKISSAEDKVIKLLYDNTLVDIGDFFEETIVISAISVKVLIEIGTTKAVLPLIEMLSSQTQTILKDAITALGNIGDKRAVEPLNKFLAGYSDTITIATIEALGKIDIDSVLDDLLPFLKHDNLLVVHTAIQAVIRVNREEVILALLPLLDDTRTYKVGRTSYTINLSIADRLGEMGSPLAIQSLIDVLDSEDESLVKTSIEALIKSHNSSAIEHLERILDDTEHHLRPIVIEKLGIVGNEWTIQTLVRYYIASNPSFVGSNDWRAKIGWDTEAIFTKALDSSDSSYVVDELIKHLHHDNQHVTVAFILLLSKRKDTNLNEATDSIATFLSDMRVTKYFGSDKTVGQVAVDALERIDSEKSREQLEQAKNTDDVYTLINLTLELEDIGNVFTKIHIIDVISSHIHELDTPILKLAVEALGKLKDIRSTEPLVELLNHEDEEIVKASIRSLTNMQDEHVVQSFAQAVLKQDEASQQRVLENLQYSASQELRDAFAKHNIQVPPKPDWRSRLGKRD